MAGALASVEGRILGRSESGEKHLRLELFSPTEGGIVAHARQAHGKRPGPPPPDLFDRVSLELEAASKSRLHFVREARIEASLPQLSRSYDAFVEATTFARTIWKNLPHVEHFGELFMLHERALEAFARRLRPEVTHFKALYLFAKLEGYPVKEEMLASWSRADQANAKRLLTEPLDGDQPSTEAARQLLERLSAYLRGYTDIWIAD